MKRLTTRKALPWAAVALAAGLSLSGCASGDSDEAASTPSPSASMSQDMAMMPEGASATEGDFELQNMWAKESSLDMSAAFGTITNNADEDDALVGASAPGVPTVELHETVDGVMQQVESFPIPAGGTLELKPGANHIMLMGLVEPLKVGETLELTLTFESGATATIEVPIEPFSMDDGHSDS